MAAKPRDSTELAEVKRLKKRPDRIDDQDRRFGPVVRFGG
jgi:hypothetical protein